jgi:hypothetical protein
MASSRWKRNPDVVERRIGDEMILVPIGRDIVEQRCLFTLNETASFIWNALEIPGTAADVQHALVEAFDVTPDRARKDVDRFMAELAGAGCIVEEI